MKRLTSIALLLLWLPAAWGKPPVYELEIRDHLFHPEEVRIPANTKVKLVVYNRDSTPEEFDQMSSSVLVNRKQDVEVIWERRSAMLTHIRSDQWQSIISSAKAAQEEEQAKQKAKAEKKAAAKKKPKAYPL